MVTQKYSAKLSRLESSKKTMFSTQSYSLPRWVDKLAYFGVDMPLFLEVDFTILSMMILYQPDSVLDVHPAMADHVLVHLYRLYNWRPLA